MSGRQVNAGEERTRGADVHREESTCLRVDNLPLCSKWARGDRITEVSDQSEVNTSADRVCYLLFTSL